MQFRVLRRHGSSTWEGIIEAVRIPISVPTSPVLIRDISNDSEWQEAFEGKMSLRVLNAVIQRLSADEKIYHVTINSLSEVFVVDKIA